MTRRIFHVSNRIEIPQAGKPTAGGVDEAIADPPQGYEVVRFGWSGRTVSDDIEDLSETIQDIRANGIRFITYDMRETDLKGFYSGCANGVIWPANHFRDDITLQGFDSSYIQNGIERNAWDDIETYYKVNEEVAALAKKYVEPNDIIIVHDYHFIPFGTYFKAEQPIGYFHHTPMLTNDFLETLDQDQQRFFFDLYSNFYNYDFVGLQTAADLLALHSTIGKSEIKTNIGFFDTVPFSNEQTLSGKRTHFGAFPVAGNSQKYTTLAKQYENSPFVTEYMRRLPSDTVDLMSVDRRDYSKGLVSKVVSIGNWMHNFGKNGDRIDLLQIAPKGREDVRAYLDESMRIETAVEAIKGSFGDVIYLDGGKIERGHHLGLARNSSAALVTPTRDGMNLYVSEYLAAQIGRDNPGVAIVSRFAGVASVYGDSLVLVDPRRPDSISRGIQRARIMTQAERQELLGRATQVSEFFTNTRWQINLIQATLDSSALRLQAS